MGSLQINNSAIQDMFIFGDPSRVPVILVERHVMDLRMHASGRASFSVSLEKKAMSAMGTGDKALLKLFVGGTQRSSRTLRIVVFVHGFQVHPFNLFAKLISYLLRYYSS